ncbi:pilus assembly protein [Iamia sp. SCSIO 61187]|uniref:TadE/TadG family type IV pilus assembly protein n=1 Tax=Iamia sp. SCSIO 61187 TaxID=2722752 RepID=UPI001C6281EC|nr:TadE/TadG family type IV pilus assembly protein [Iamia sp. SCSIO 61187]QYG92540.1 pilus assembly protein [Iamia sp. SCSIO 61187]
MQLAHRRRSRPFRAGADDRSLGAVLVEAAFVTPIFFMMVLGIGEVSLAMNDKLALANTVRAGTRVASASGNDTYADYGIIRAIVRESAALPRDQIQMIIVYRASKLGEAPPAACLTGTPQDPGASPTAPACNVYFPSDFDAGKDSFGCVSSDFDRSWCPRGRKISLSGAGTEYVGVWLKVEHPWLTKMFGDTVTLTDHSVIRLEPRLK